MRRKGSVVLFLILVSTFTLGSTAHAGGWGPYFEWGRIWPDTGIPSYVTDLVVKNNPSLENIIREVMGATELSLSFDHLSVGAVYDTAPSQDRLFNFRIAFGFDWATNGQLRSVSGFGKTGDEEIDYYVDLAKAGVDAVIGETSSYGGVVHMSFGFSPIRNSLFKWWIGPGIRINGDYFQPELVIAEYGLDRVATIQAGGGPETGVNFHIGSFMSLCVSAGFHWNAFGLASSDSEYEEGGVVWGNGPFCFVQTTALFHTGGDREAWSAPEPSGQPGSSAY